MEKDANRSFEVLSDAKLWPRVVCTGNQKKASDRILVTIVSPSSTPSLQRLAFPRPSSVTIVDGAAAASRPAGRNESGSIISRGRLVHSWFPSNAPDPPADRGYVDRPETELGVRRLVEDAVVVDVAGADEDAVEPVGASF